MRLTLMLLSALALSACSEPRQSIALIVVDTLRTDYLLDPGSVAPRMQGFARSGTTFEQGFAASSWTGASMAAIMTGRYPDELGIHELFDPLAPDLQTLAEILQDAGYTTSAVVSNWIAGPDFGHNQGYDEFYYERYKEPGDHILERNRRPHFTADQVTDRALAWLARPRKEPFFLYVHYTDPHEPYLPPARWRYELLEGHEPLPDIRLLHIPNKNPEQARDAIGVIKRYYRGEIAFADHEIGRLLDGLPPGCLVVLTSDHGEEFLEHGGLLHSTTLHEELVRVPVIFQGPGVPEGSSVEMPVSHTDLLPTILDWVGLDVPDGLSGRSLRAHLDATAPVAELRPVFSVLEIGGARQSAVRLGSWKMIRTGKHTSLFDLDADPAEQNDLSGEHAEIFAALKEELDAWRWRPMSPSHQDSPALHQRRQEALRSIGYIE